MKKLFLSTAFLMCTALVVSAQEKANTNSAKPISKTEKEKVAESKKDDAEKIRMLEQQKKKAMNAEKAKEQEALKKEEKKQEQIQAAAAAPAATDASAAEVQPEVGAKTEREIPQPKRVEATPASKKTKAARAKKN